MDVWILHLRMGTAELIAEIAVPDRNVGTGTEFRFPSVYPFLEDLVVHELALRTRM